MCYTWHWYASLIILITAVLPYPVISILIQVDISNDTITNTEAYAALMVPILYVPIAILRRLKKRGSNGAQVTSSTEDRLGMDSITAYGIAAEEWKQMTYYKQVFYMLLINRYTLIKMSFIMLKVGLFRGISTTRYATYILILFISMLASAYAPPLASYVDVII